jgi:ArsR family transcriptional regulator
MKETVKQKDQYEAVTQVLRAVAHPVRLRMLLGLCRKECNVSGLWKELKISQPLASQHLNRMRLAGLIVGERRGQETCYHVADQRIEKLLGDMFHFTETRNSAASKKRR